ncbi:unnamed protein product [Scytosiphon promiscuus]
MSATLQPGDTDVAVESVPSVKEILEEVAVEAGLPDAYDDDFTPVDEDETARDVAKALSAVRPLLERYRHRHDKLTALLSKSQASASSATAGARELSRDHLRTFGRLEESCAALRQEDGACKSCAAQEVTRESPDSSSSPEGLGGGGAENTEASAARGRASAVAAAAAEADALAARHRSLVQRRRRMRSALHVLRVSESGREALEAEAGPIGVGILGSLSKVFPAMDAIDSLRGLLGERRDAVAASAADVWSAAAKTGTGRETGASHVGEESGGDGVESGSDRLSPAAEAEGELARVARGRLAWLTRRLRYHLSSELASALRQADPLAAGRGDGESGEGLSEEDKERRREAVARVEEATKRLIALQFGRRLPLDGTSGGAAVAAGRTGGGAEAGAVWALDCLLEPVAVRFRFHFEGDRPTNRVDRPEWFLSFLLRALDAYRPLLLHLLTAEGVNPREQQRQQQQLLPARDAGGTGPPRAGTADGVWGAAGVDPLAYFARGLALLARRRLRAQLGAAAADGSLLSHTVQEALAFDRTLDREAGYAECPARFPRQAWPRCVEVFAQDEDRFERWMDSDANAAEAKLREAAAAPGAWRAVGWKNGPPSSTPVTPSAVAMCRLFSDVTERYRPLRDPLKQLRFARRVQQPVLRSYRDMLYWRGNDCRLNSVFRDDGGGGFDGEAGGAGGVTSAADGMAATWAAALGAAMLGAGLGVEDEGDKTPIGRWRGYCLVVSSCAYVCAVLQESEDDMLFAEMGETAAAAVAAAAAAAAGWAAGGEMTVEGQHAAERPPSSSLGAVGNAVGAAVGGVSQAVNSAATTAETATAGVVRAVGSQSNIIGPTHAISAALTSLKGAARRVRKASTSSSSASSGHRHGDGNGIDNLNGSGGNLDGGIGGDSGGGTAGTGMPLMATPEEGLDEGGGSTDIGNSKNSYSQRDDDDVHGGREEGSRRSGDAFDAAATGADGRRYVGRPGGGGGGGAPESRVAADAAAAAAAAAVGEWTGSVFGEEAQQYGVMLEAMMRGAVESCRDGFLWRTRSYLRAWDRGIAVVVRATGTSSSSSARPGGSSASTAPAAASVAEPSGRLCAGVGLLETAVGVAESSLPAAQFHQFWTGLAHELDLALAKQIVHRRSEISQGEGLQLWADVRALMGPFDTLARRRPERHFPALVEAAVLLSLEKVTSLRYALTTEKKRNAIDGTREVPTSQLRSLSSGLDAHGGGVEEVVRGCGWDGWREEGGALSPEGVQMRDMLENVGVRHLGPAEASLLLDKRLKGDRLAMLGYLSAAAAGGGDGTGRSNAPSNTAGIGSGGGGAVVSVDGGGRSGGFGGMQAGAAARETAVPSFG